jgi:hypothetical protein
VIHVGGAADDHGVVLGDVPDRCRGLRLGIEPGTSNVSAIRSAMPRVAPCRLA